MSGTTAIDWTDATWNPLPWRCTQVSPGCDNCYALALTDRFRGRGTFTSGPPSGLRLNRLLLPWIDPQFREAFRIFAVSMSDPLHGGLPIEDLALIWAVIAADPHHLYQVLSKRQGIMLSRLGRPEFPAMVREALNRLAELAGKGKRMTPARRRILGGIEAASDVRLPLPNVMLGVSAEDRCWWEIRVPVLRQVPAAARFVSVEPYLDGLGEIDLSGIDWVICGGESGPRHRPMDLDWLESLVSQCREANVAVWVKQDAHRSPGQQGRIPGNLWIKQHCEVAGVVKAVGAGKRSGTGPVGPGPGERPARSRRASALAKASAGPAAR